MVRVRNCTVDGGRFEYYQNVAGNLHDSHRIHMKYDPQLDGFVVKSRGPSPDHCWDRIFSKERALKEMCLEEKEFFHEFRVNHCLEIMD